MFHETKNCHRNGKLAYTSLNQKMPMSTFACNLSKKSFWSHHRQNICWIILGISGYDAVRSNG